MSQQLENQLSTYLDNLSRSGQQGQLAPMFANNIGQQMTLENGATYKVNQSGVLEKIQFEETAKILDTSSSNSVLGIGIGAAAAGAVTGFVQGTLGANGTMLQGIPPGLLTIGIGYALQRWVLKNGFGNSVAKGVMVGGIATVSAGPIASITAGFVGGQ